ncbi:diphosphoinositol polyphosphate phosphohydrolase 1 isoform X1 [Cygnus olor]|uniref:diphosphoinositol polyphosphate phosphohydrolase 1 isoform X1 n=1 Tax=Cygnus olor TaxID=8869 RepID=UPI001ADE7118|nr:diphosphoinositol polyphosphate phosphohydrolase 1 isoform X1 [Cygnus olor]
MPRSSLVQNAALPELPRRPLRSGSRGLLDVCLHAGGKVGGLHAPTPRVTERKKAAQNESLHVLGWWNSLVLLVSSSRHPDRWIVPGGGMEPEEEPNVAAVREVCEEAGVKGTLGRLVGIFENRDRKHRTYVYVLIVTEVLEDWEDSVNIGRKREWFKIEDAIKVLQYHKPVQASYFETLRQGCLANNGTPVMTTTYSESSVSDIR